MIGTLIIAAAFDVIALVDSLDFANVFDIETETGTIQVVDHVMRTRPTEIWWRDKGGGLMRYPSREEGCAISHDPLDKRRVSRQSVYGYLKLDATSFDVFGLVASACEERGIGFGIHTTFEENHRLGNTESSWNLRHPQFAGRNRLGMPRLATCSLAYPEVLEHKLAMVNERLALKPKRIFLDCARTGGWSAAFEYVPPVIEAWEMRHRCAPPANPMDERWLELVGEYQIKYLKEFSRRCREAGVEFWVGLAHFGMDDKYVNRSLAFDWRRLAREQIVDGIVVMGVDCRAQEPFESTQRILKRIVSAAGKTKVMFHASKYGVAGFGLPRYSKFGKVSEAEAAKRLVNIARGEKCCGVILECVDYGNYSQDICNAIHCQDSNEKECK